MSPLFSVLTFWFLTMCTWGTGVQLAISPSEFSLMIFLSPLSSLLILQMALYTLKEGCTNEGNVLTDSVVWDLHPYGLGASSSLGC